MMEGTARKKTRKGKPGVSKNCGATQSYRNTLDSNRYLTYDILRIIFQYLNARDLGNAAMVCRSWSEAANNEKSIRGPCCFIISSYTEHEFSYKMENIRIKPSVGFFVIPSGISWDIEDRIEDLLPAHCEAIMLDCHCMSFHNDDDDDDDPPAPRRVCAFLPQIPNVRIKSFKVSNHRVIQKSAEYRKIISTIVDQTSISNDETSTCFMLFCKNYFGQPTARHWASVMQESEEVKIASVWGGMVNEIFVPRTRKTKKRSFPKKDANCVAVLITGSIQTWSTILDVECDTKEQVEARLKLFKDEVKLKKHSLGFMITHRYREIRISKAFDVETTIFKRLFPKVPLVGCSSFGVFGKTTVDEGNEEKNEEKHNCKKSKKSWYNVGVGSTVFLILTYG